MLNNQEYLSITQLTNLFNHLLDEQLGPVSFEGELFQVTRAKSGHIYFFLKDQNSQIPAVIWQGSARSLGFVPQDGMAVLCQGRANIYGRSGRLQMIVNRMELGGEGLLRKKFLELKAKLEREGLFAAERKRALPFFPSRVGIVSSATGAALQDMLVKIRERMPATKVVLIDVRVQGVGSAQEIAAAIQQFNALDNVDVLIVGRGGGSLEDLWAFNEEVVVRAIFASRIPVISAVGHEVDISLADLVADYRAPTPTAAAERVVPLRGDLLLALKQLQERLNNYQTWLEPKLQVLDELETGLNNAFRHLIQQRQLQLEKLNFQLTRLEPGRLLAQRGNLLDSLQLRLQAGQKFSIDRSRQRYRLLVNAMQAGRLRLRLTQAAVSLNRDQQRLDQAVSGMLKNYNQRLDSLGRQLESISHKRVLERGYAIVQSAGKLITDSAQVARGDRLAINLARGTIQADVQDNSKDS